MPLVVTAQNPSRLLGKLRENAPRRMLVPLEPPRPPRRKLVSCRSARLLFLLLLGPLALCLELFRWLSMRRPSPWPALLPIFPELPGTFLLLSCFNLVRSLVLICF